jgi:uncharacterized protein YjdB
MLKRISVGAIALAGLTMAMFTGCSATQVDTVTISPTSQTLQVAQTAQFTATGTISHGQHPSSSETVTDTVTWTSSAPAVAVISSTGLATAISPGTTTITATMSGFPGQVSATATVTVTGTGSVSTTGNVSALTIIPGTQSVSGPGYTTQFIAIGTTSSGATENLTSQVAWSSSSSQIATIGASTGIATAVAQGTVTITAIYSNATAGTAVTGTATFTVTSGASEPITALEIIPGPESLATTQAGQFLALGTSGITGLMEDVTRSSQLTWSSSIPSIGTISSTGLATGVAVGSTAITAEWKNPDGSVVSATENLSVTSATSTLLSLTIIPSSITVGNLQDTGNFIAVGTFSTPPIIRDLTNSVTWLSSAPNVFPVNTNSNPPNPGAPGGIATAYGNGNASIIAEATDPVSGSIQTATATFACPLVEPNPTATPPVLGSCYPGSQAPGLLTTLTVYNEGLNTTNWLVTAPSATGTANVLHCGPGWAAGGNSGGSVCVATYPVGTSITLTAPAQSGVSFGGWSVNCTPNPNPPTQAGPNQCTMIVTDTNVTVGAIFN